MVDTTASRASATRGFVALMLLTAGVLVLAGRAVLVVGDSLALVLGIEFLVWAGIAHHDGLLVTGGVLTGIGVGVLLAAWPLHEADPHVIGAAFLLSVAAGFLVVAVLSSWWRPRQGWAWICAAVIGVVGGGLFAGSDMLARLLAWGLPAALLGGGVLVGYRWLRSSRA
jgi:hypothetical protein